MQIQKSSSPIILIAIALFTVSFCHTGNAQTLIKKLRPHITDAAVEPSQQVQTQYIKPTDTLKVNYDAGHSGVATGNTVLNFQNIHSLQVSDTVKAVHKRDYAKFRKMLNIDDSAASTLKVIPELFVKEESTTGQNKLYSLIFLENSPLRYDFGKKSFIGQLSFFLIEESADPNNARAAIEEPVIMQIASPDVETIDPKEISVTKLYSPNDIQLAADHVQDSAKIKIVTRSNTKGYDTYIKVRPVLEVTSDQKVLQGMGIQESYLTVRYIGSRSSRAVRVTLSASKGTLTPNTLDLKYNEPQIVTLRSTGIGGATITAHTASDDSTFSLRYIFPWVFLLASVGGGLIGAFAKHLSGESRKKITPKPIILGVLIGLLGAIAYYILGVNLLEFKMNETMNEFAVLGFSGLCAYLGIRK